MSNLDKKIENNQESMDRYTTLIEKFELDVKKRSRLNRFLLVLDQMFNVILWNGSQDETISSHIHRRIESGKANWFEFDVVVATPDMMGVVGRLGRVLGPKGLMPNPKAGTVTMDVTKAVNDIKAGKIEYRLDKTNIIHVPIGKASFTEEQLSDNFQAIMDAIVKAKPSSLKGAYLRSVVLTSTMGPGVKLSTAKYVG